MSTTTPHRLNPNEDTKYCFIFPVYDDTTPFEPRYCHERCPSLTDRGTSPRAPEDSQAGRCTLYREHDWEADSRRISAPLCREHNVGQCHIAKSPSKAGRPTNFVPFSFWEPTRLETIRKCVESHGHFLKPLGAPHDLCQVWAKGRVRDGFISVQRSRVRLWV